MNKEAAFWDASAVVPLCVEELTTKAASAYLERFDLVVWWASSVEVHSALARLQRNGDINARGKEGGLVRLKMLQQSWREIFPEDAVREMASHLLDMYPLRAADSLQLAAALTWCQQRPAARTFICGDKKLAEAARTAGFSVLELVRTTA